MSNRAERRAAEHAAKQAAAKPAEVVSNLTPVAESTQVETVTATEQEPVKAELVVEPVKPADAQEKIVMNGQPVQGPNEKAGKDAVPAKLSFHDVGVTHAKACSKADDTLAQNQSIIRPQLLLVLKAPQEVWETYTAGFKTVLDERKKDGKPTAALGVLRSRITRLFNTAKKQHSYVVKQLSDSKLSWAQVLKSMPKSTSAGRPAENTITVDGITAELNVGTLLQICSAAAMQMAKLGREKAAPFAHYMGSNIVDFIQICEKDFQRITGEHLVGGIIKDQGQYLTALGLIEKEPRQPAAKLAA